MNRFSTLMKTYMYLIDDNGIHLTISQSPNGYAMASKRRNTESSQFRYSMGRMI